MVFFGTKLQNLFITLHEIEIMAKIDIKKIKATKQKLLENGTIIVKGNINK